jgi:hypothetical protein
MARIEWVKQRLENWARWHSQRDSGGLGYPKQCAFLRLAAHGTRAGNVIPIDSVDASITDDAVKALQDTHAHLYITLRHVYLAGIGIEETARRVGRARSTVIAQLGQADQQLALWFGERAQKRRKSFTS